MLNKLRERAQNEKGFTLIELLVVILIIGILAAIALPAFLNQREKAQASEAKSGARTVQAAMETYYTDNQSYAGVNSSTLQTIEPAISQFAGRLALTPAPTSNTYSVTVTSRGSGAHTFTIARDATGNVTRSCGNGCSGSW